MPRKVSPGDIVAVEFLDHARHLEGTQGLVNMMAYGLLNSIEKDYYHVLVFHPTQEPTVEFTSYSIARSCVIKITKLRGL